jgi:hypothetical protein
MLGWSIRARAWRSDSKRASTCLLSMPGLMTFTATRRLTGSVCWAIHTVPMPPSPISSTSLYRPDNTAPTASPAPLPGGGPVDSTGATPAGS